MARIHQEPLQKGYHLMSYKVAQALWIDELKDILNQDGLRGDVTQGSVAESLH
jgi:hypothetical protein